MSFKNGAYAQVWEHSAGKGNYHDGRISTSKLKNGKFESDFKGYVRFIGDAKTKIEKINEQSFRIKILSCEVTNKYDKEKKREYVNYAIFDFEVVDNKDKTKNISNSNQSESTKNNNTIINTGNIQQNANQIDSNTMALILQMMNTLQQGGSTNEQINIPNI